MSVFHLMYLGNRFMSMHIELPLVFQWLNYSPLDENARIYLTSLLLKSIWFFPQSFATTPNAAVNMLNSVLMGNS